MGPLPSPHALMPANTITPYDHTCHLAAITVERAFQHWISPSPKDVFISLWQTSTSHLCHAQKSSVSAEKGIDHPSLSHTALTKKKAGSLWRLLFALLSTPLTTTRKTGRWAACLSR